jgi:flagellar hook-basal body complex protein FliE
VQDGDGDGLAGPVIRKAKDNSLKLILGEPELFIEFLHDFIGMDIFTDVSASDIVDISERFLPLFEEGKDSDTVKRINLKDGVPLFVIAIVEHESKVNFRSSFKMLQYIVMVLDNYEKEANKANIGISVTKDFKYPPILPVVFFDGDGDWTAETNFLYKTEMHEVFEKYIPKFDYELVNLNDYSPNDLVEFGDTLSLLMLIDKIKTADGLSMLRELPPDYVEKLALNIPAHLNKLITDVITLLLTKAKVPPNETEAITEKIYRKEYRTMFTALLDDIARKQEEARDEGKLEGAINIVREMHIPISKAMSIMKLQENSRERLIKALMHEKIAYTE